MRVIPAIITNWRSRSGRRALPGAEDAGVDSFGSRLQRLTEGWKSDVEASPQAGAASPPAFPDPETEFARFRNNAAAYLKSDDLKRIEAAYRFGALAHSGQTRLSGEPYITHPLAVANVLTVWHLDAQALIAALLHDVMEDTAVTKQEIGEKFGRVTADLVDGVSKLGKIEFQSHEDAQAENFRKMLLAMARDLRVILIKLADRLHNMRTLDAVRPDKRRRIARETLEIYSPIANRLGLNSLFRELEELAFKHLHPLRHRALERALRAARGNRREVFGSILHAIKKRLPERGIEADVYGREKHLYSIYTKMKEKSLSFSQVLDIYGFRVVVKDVPACYLALGALHGLYKPVPGKFKDYIAIPKANGYQSLHTTLIGPYGAPLEVQIRTVEMHRLAETGVASHWLYKDTDSSLSELQRQTDKWLQSLLELQKTSGDAGEFLEHLKIDLFPDEVYVFTPKGKILALPRGATAVDFAYAVHTDIGNRCVACRINYELMPLRTELKNGDQVDIITAAHVNPNPAWLSYVKTGKARSQIRHYLKTMQQDESAALGERMLTQALRPFNLPLAQVSVEVWERFLKDAGGKTRQELLTEIGLGKRLATIVARRLAESQGAIGAAPVERLAAPVRVRGSDGNVGELAKCCKPIPGDTIAGVVRNGQGLVVHTDDCANIRGEPGEQERRVEVAWNADSGRLFDVSIRVMTQNRRGVLAKVATEISEAGSNIQNVSMDDECGDRSWLFFTLQVADRSHLARIMRHLRRIPEVGRITRIKE